MICIRFYQLTKINIFNTIGAKTDFVAFGIALLNTSIIRKELTLYSNAEILSMSTNCNMY